MCPPPAILNRRRMAVGLALRGATGVAAGVLGAARPSRRVPRVRESLGQGRRAARASRRGYWGWQHPIASPERQGSGAHPIGARLGRVVEGRHALAGRAGTPARCKRGSKGTASESPRRGNVAKQCITALFVAISLRPLSWPSRLRHRSPSACFLARGRQWTITRKMALRATFRGTQALISDTLVRNGRRYATGKLYGNIPVGSKDHQSRKRTLCRRCCRLPHRQQNSRRACGQNSRLFQPHKRGRRVGHFKPGRFARMDGQNSHPLEHGRTRRKAQGCSTCREFILAVPKELSAEQQFQAVGGVGASGTGEQGHGRRSVAAPSQGRE